MTNGEKYKDELLDFVSDGALFDLGDFKELFNNVIAKDLNLDKAASNCTMADFTIALGLWLNMEYKEPETDWSKVAVDTPILVKNRDFETWTKRYFAAYDKTDETVYAWSSGATSWSTTVKSKWEYAKLAE